MESPSGNILVVDDQPAHRKAVSFNLVNAGYDVKTAKGGLEALSLAQQEQFDLIITDYYMPDCTGTDLVLKLRRLDNYYRTPVILLTGKAGELNQEYMREHLSVLVLPKPCPLARLLETVSTCFEMLGSAP